MNISGSMACGIFAGVLGLTARGLDNQRRSLLSALAGGLVAFIRRFTLGRLPHTKDGGR